MFSVIVPTRNRPHRLVKCLESFTLLDYPEGEWELIVVNDGGTDSFAALSPELQHRLPLTLLTVEQGGPAAARNAGARVARGDYLAFTDDDCHVTAGWLNTLADGFTTLAVDGLGGRPCTPFDDRAAEQAWQHLVDFLYYYLQDRDGNALLLLSNNVAYRRSVFEAVGGFNESFPLAAAEDMELGYRLLCHGYRQRYYPEAKVWHYHQLTPWKYISQQFRYGRGAYYFQQALQQLPGAQQIQLHSSVPFYEALLHFLKHARVPKSISLLIGTAQLAYHLGLFYQTKRYRS